MGGFAVCGGGLSGDVFGLRLVVGLWFLVAGFRFLFLGFVVGYGVGFGY